MGGNRGLASSRKYCLDTIEKDIKKNEFPKQKFVTVDVIAKNG